MGWQTEMVLIVRHLINDFDASCYAYTNDRLEQTILISAQLTIFEVDFDKTYTIDVDALTLTPDPTAEVRDNAFINIVCLKTACIILSAEAQAQAGKAIKVKDGPSEIDMSRSYPGVADVAKTACENYRMAIVQYNAGNSRAGEAILGPITTSQAFPLRGNFN